MSPPTPTQRRLQARLAALARWSRASDPARRSEATAAARAAFERRFTTQAKADAAARGEVISQAEIAYRAAILRRKYFATIHLKAAKARKP